MIQIYKVIIALAISASAVPQNLKVDIPECTYGPVACGIDYITGESKFCGNDQACGQVCTESGCKNYCFKLAPGQCRKQCPEGQTLNPVEWCECIDIKERDSMFCAAEPSPD